MLVYVEKTFILFEPLEHDNANDYIPLNLNVSNIAADIIILRAINVQRL